MQEKEIDLANKLILIKKRICQSSESIKSG